MLDVEWDSTDYFIERTLIFVKKEKHIAYILQEKKLSS